MANPISEFFVKLGFTTDAPKVRDFINVLGDLNIASVATALGFGEAFHVLENWTNKTAEASKEGIKFNRETGLSIEKMNKLALLFERLGATKEDAQAAIKAVQDFQKNLLIGKIGEKNIWAGFFGVAPGEKDIFNVIEKIRSKYLLLIDQFQREGMALDKAIEEATKRVTGRLEQGGMSPAVMMYVRANQEQIESMNEITGLNNQQSEAVYQLSYQFKALSQILDQVIVKKFGDIAIALQPIVDLIYRFGKLPIKITGESFASALTGGLSRQVSVAQAVKHYHISIDARGSDETIIQKIKREIEAIFSEADYQSPQQEQ